MSDQEIMEKMEGVWRSIAGVCDTLSESEWSYPTDCPGWSVQDQLSHLVGSECRLLGRPTPDHTPGDLGHVRNETGENNEILVDWRRSRSGSQVLGEFKEVTRERLRILRGMSAEDFGAETQTPLGPGTVRDLLAIRIFDAWVHEQDIRRAVARPGHLQGPVAEHSIGRVAMAMPYVVGRKVKPPDGTTVILDVTGPCAVLLAIGMEGGRGRLLETLPNPSDVRLTLDAETFACLGCGRWEPQWSLAANKVDISGDQALGEAIVSQMNIMI